MAYRTIFSVHALRYRAYNCHGLICMNVLLECVVVLESLIALLEYISVLKLNILSLLKQSPQLG